MGIPENPYCNEDGMDNNAGNAEVGQLHQGENGRLVKYMKLTVGLVNYTKGTMWRLVKYMEWTEDGIDKLEASSCEVALGHEHQVKWMGVSQTGWENL